MTDPKEIIQKELDAKEHDIFDELYEAIVEAFEDTLTNLTSKEYVSTHATMAATVYATVDIINSHPPVMTPKKPQDAENFKRAAFMTFALQLEVLDMLHPDVVEHIKASPIYQAKNEEAE